MPQMPKLAMLDRLIRPGAWTAAAVVGMLGAPWLGVAPASAVVTARPDPMLVSRTSGGAPASANVDAIAISADGRYIAFESDADDLGGGTDGTQQIYLEDSSTGTLSLVSRAAGADGTPGDDYSDSPSVSEDGRYVCFESSADNLMPGVSGEHVYVRDLQTNTLILVDRPSGSTTASPLGSGDDGPPVISADGRYVAFETDYDGDFGAPVGTEEAVVRDLDTNADKLVSRASGAGGPPANDADDDGGTVDAISSDGRYVVFDSRANNLDPAATDETDQVYLRDTQQNTTTLVSQQAGVGGARDSHGTSVADDGAVAFATNADNLGPDSGAGNLFVRSPDGTLTLVSRSYGLDGAPDYTAGGEISADGRYVVWTGSGNALSDAPPQAFVSGGVFRREVATGDQDVVDRTALGMSFGGGAAAVSDGWGAAVSADGSAVAFASYTGQAVAPDAPANVTEAYRADESEPTPVATATPSVAGTPRVGRALTCLSGDWSAEPTLFSWQWLLDGTAIPGATGRVYAATAADLGHQLSCRVSASNGMAGIATSPAVTVAPAQTAATGAFVFVNEFGGQGDGTGKFSTGGPDGVAVSPDGNLLVIDRGEPGSQTAGTTELYSPAGRFIRAFAGSPAGPYPTGVAASPDGSIVISNGETLTRYTEDGYFLGSSTCAFTDLGTEDAIAVDHEGRIYVGGTTPQGAGFVVCAPDGHKLGGPYAIGTTRTPSSTPLAVGPDDDLYTMGDDSTVVVFDHAGKLLRTIPLGGAYGGYGAELAVDPDGRLWLANFAGQVNEFSPQGKKLSTLSDPGSHTGQISDVSGLAIGGDGTIVVADTDRHFIERFRAVAPSSGGNGAGPGGGGGAAGSAGGGTVINVDRTPPVLQILGGPTTKQLRHGRVTAALRCNERCTVTVSGEIAVVRRTVSRLHGARKPRKHPGAKQRKVKLKRHGKSGARSARARRRKHQQRGRARDGCPPVNDPDCVPKRFGKGRLKPRPPYRAPSTLVTSRVLAASDIDASTGTLASGVAGRIALVIPASERAGIRKAVLRGTSVLFTLTVTAADPTGNASDPQTLEGRISL